MLLPDNIVGGITDKLAGLAVIDFAILHAARAGAARRFGWWAMGLGGLLLMKPWLLGQAGRNGRNLR